MANHLLKTKPILPFNGKITRKRKRRSSSQKKSNEKTEDNEGTDILLPLEQKVSLSFMNTSPLPTMPAVPLNINHLDDEIVNPSITPSSPSLNSLQSQSSCSPKCLSSPLPSPLPLVPTISSYGPHQSSGSSSSALSLPSFIPSPTSATKAFPTVKITIPSEKDYEEVRKSLTKCKPHSKVIFDFDYAH